MKMAPSHYRRKRSKASKKKKRSPKPKNVVAKPVDEEEVVWFSNPSKEAARARREEAKDIMGRELWSTIMEDSSDEDDDEEDEEFYFYDGGWHSSPRPIKPGLLLAEVNQSATDRQVLEFADEGSAKNVVVDVVERVNQSLLNHGEDPIKIVLNKHDANGTKFGSVDENVQGSNVPVIVDEVEMRHNDDDVEEITRDVVPIVAVAVLFEEKHDEGDNDNEQGHRHNDDDDDDDVEFDLCRNDRDTDCELCGVDAPNKGCKRVSSNAACFESNHVIVSIESVCDDDEANDARLGGFKCHKIRAWIRYVARKIRGWAVNICRTLIPCIVASTHTEPETTQSQ